MLQSAQQLLTHFAACTADSSFFSIPTWYKYLKPHDVQGVCSIAFVFPDSIPLVALAVVDILLRLAALIAVGFVIYGGIRYTTSQGEPQATASARETIIGALVGLVIATIASAMVSFIGNKIGG